MALAGVSLAVGSATPNPTTTSSVAPSTSVVFVWVVYQLTAAPPTVSSISGLSGSWSEVTNLLASNGNFRVSLWAGTGCTGSGTLTITPSAGPTSGRYAIEEFTGGIHTTTPVVSSNTKQGSAASGTTGSVTPNALANVNNAFYVGTDKRNTGDVTPLQGTEITDDSALGGSNGIATSALVGWTSGTMGGSWATSAAWATVGVEIAASTVLTPIPRVGPDRRAGN